MRSWGSFNVWGATLSNALSISRINWADGMIYVPGGLAVRAWWFSDAGMVVRWVICWRCERQVQANEIDADLGKYLGIELGWGSGNRLRWDGLDNLWQPEARARFDVVFRLLTRNNIKPILHKVEIVRILALDVYIALKTDKRIVKSSLTLLDNWPAGLHCPRSKSWYVLLRCYRI